MSIKIGSINVSSLRVGNRDVEIDRYLNKENFDVCFIQETRLNKDVNNTWRGMDHFTAVRDDKGVGVLVLVRKNIKYSVIRPKMGHVQAVGIIIRAGKAKTLSLFTIYVPCHSNSEQINAGLDLIASHCQYGNTIIRPIGNQQ